MTTRTWALAACLVFVVAACSATNAPGVSCQRPSWGHYTCQDIVDIALANTASSVPRLDEGTLTGLRQGNHIRVVDVASTAPRRTSGDLALIVLSPPFAPMKVILVGWVGIDREPSAWLLPAKSYDDYLGGNKCEGKPGPAC